MTDAPAPVYTFRDGAIQQPALRTLNGFGRVLGRVGLQVPQLDIDAIAATAAKRAGSDNFGSDSWREPMARFIDSVDTESDASLLGRAGIKNTLISSLTNRIKLADWHRDHPEVGAEQIVAPWVIVGLPRTGTSLLSILLGLDPNNRALTHWEGDAPIPPPTLATAAEDPRIAACARQIEQLHQLIPALQAMHPFGATIAQECVALFMFDIRTLGLQTQAYVPGYGKWLARCDMSPAYLQHRMALQALQSTQPTQHWVLKTPNHLWSLATLLEFYPDARIIWTHRDPADVVTSTASLINTMHRAFSNRTDPKPTANEWRQKLLDGLQSGMAFDDAQTDGWCYHLPYQRFVADPAAAINDIYAHFGETVGELHQRRIEVWMQERHQTAFGKHQYDPSDFGWSREELEAEFSTYSQRYLA